MTGFEPGGPVGPMEAVRSRSSVLCGTFSRVGEKATARRRRRLKGAAPADERDQHMVGVSGPSSPPKMAGS